MKQSKLKRLEELEAKRREVNDEIRSLEADLAAEASNYGHLLGKYVRYHTRDENDYCNGVCMRVDMIRPGGGNYSTLFSGPVVWPSRRSIENNSFYLHDDLNELDENGDVKFTIELISEEEFMRVFCEVSDSVLLVRDYK